jgi:hypothetical protein
MRWDTNTNLKGDDMIVYELRREDGSVWKRLCYLGMAEVVASRDSADACVGPLTIVPVWESR